MRVFRFSIVIGLLFLPLATNTASADDVSKAAKVERILQLSLNEQNLKAVLEQVKNMQLAELQKNAASSGQGTGAQQQTQTRIFNLLAETMTVEKLRPMIAKAYIDVFTEDEIDGMLAFYQSAAGQAMLRKSSQLAIRMMSAAQTLVEDVAPEVRQIVEGPRLAVSPDHPPDQAFQTVHLTVAGPPDAERILLAATNDLNVAIAKAGCPSCIYHLWKTYGQQSGPFGYMWAATWPDRATYENIHADAEYNAAWNRHPELIPVRNGEIYNRYVEVNPVK